MASVIVHNIFRITNRGYVIVGDFNDDGTISIGDTIIINEADEKIEMEILAVEMVDRRSQGIAHIGLVISEIDQAKIKDLNLVGREISTVRAAKNIT